MDRSVNGPRTTGYPEAALRGIRKAGWITPEKTISVEAFRPDSRSAREDHGKEVSITWDDDASALPCLRSAGTAAANGVAVVLRERLDHVSGLAPKNGFWYERAPQEDNPYHGNILFDARLSNAVLSNLAHVLAFYSRLMPDKAAEATETADTR